MTLRRTSVWHRLVRWLVWIWFGFSAVGAAALQDPLTYGVRFPLAAGLAVAALALTVVSLCCHHRMRAAAAALILSAVTWQVARPKMDLAHDLARASSNGVGRHFVVGYDDAETVRALARRGLIGGVFLTRRNMAGRTVEQVAAEVASIQEAARSGGYPSLIVAADQEGGSVSHLSPPLPVPPALSTLADRPEGERSEAAVALGHTIGLSLRRLGVTMDLAPVVDLKPADPPGTFDLHTRIASRAISADPATVAAIASAFSRGLLDEGIVPAAKHFPGLGSVRTDTHLFGASNGRAEADLDGDDWVPFRAVAAIPGAAVMVSHAALAAVDPGVPSSRSRPVVQGILHDRLGASLTITDDLSMGAVVHAGLCRGVLGALDAGVDILLVSWDTDRVGTAIRCALDRGREGQAER